MKQIPLLQGNVLLIELPNRPRYITLDDQGSRICYYTDKWNWVWQPTPRKSWRVIGMLSEVTEGQAAGLVEYTGLGNGVDRWLNYVNNGDKFTALESLHSSIEAEGWYFENPLENEQKRIGLGTLDNFDQDYEQAQSRVLDRSRCLLLGRDGV